jgi:esterase/lipase superfamily enzyme
MSTEIPKTQDVEQNLPEGEKLLMMHESEPATAAAAPPEDNTDKQASATQDTFTVVKVYYGTDRALQNVPKASQQQYLPWLSKTIIAGTASLFLLIVGFRLYPSRLIRGSAYACIFASCVLAALTLYTWIQTPSHNVAAKNSSSDMVYYGTDRGKLELGFCEVSIPKSHEVGELESPSVLRLDFFEDPNRHVVLLGVHHEPAEVFFSNLHNCVSRSSKKSAFVFIHGYNTTFYDAARRTAQIAYDLKFDGAPIFFSWPSQGKMLQYAVDETNIDWTAPHLLQFLKDVADRSGADQIHLIAHSMGNRAMTAALRNMAESQKAAKPMFNDVVLTAPDIDAEVFVNDIAPAIAKTAKRVTLYASSNDEALVMSKKVHGYPRAGDSGSQLVVVPGIDTIDVSAVDTSLLGHNYYGSNTSVLADLFELLQVSKPPDQRQWLRQQRFGLLKYWVFQQ